MPGPYKLGKRPARHAIKLKFASVFDAKKLPTPPRAFGHYDKVPKFYGLGNETYGNCVWVGAAYEHQIWTVAGGWDRARFTISNTLADYAAVTGFNKDDPDTDNGTDMQAAASYRRKTGTIDSAGNRHKIDAYAALEIGNVDQLLLAMYLLGACGIGLQLPFGAMEAFDRREVWAVPKGKARIQGGHYVAGVGRERTGNIVFVSWGKVHRMTPEFYERFCDEAVAYVSLELLNKQNLSPEGFDADGLRSHLKALTA